MSLIKKKSYERLNFKTQRLSFYDRILGKKVLENISAATKSFPCVFTLQNSHRF